MNQRIKHGPFWTGLFSVISLAWLFPLALAVSYTHLTLPTTVLV